MKSNAIFLILLSILSFTSCKSQSSTTAQNQNAVNQKTPAANKTPVLVELFTSEG
jgi:hypothetical protein